MRPVIRAGWAHVCFRQLSEPQADIIFPPESSPLKALITTYALREEVQTRRERWAQMQGRIIYCLNEGWKSEYHVWTSVQRRLQLSLSHSILLNLSKELIKVAYVFTLTSRLIPNLTAIFSFSCFILDSHRRTPYWRKCQPSAYESSLLIKVVMLNILQFLLGPLPLTVCKHCCAHWTAPFQGTPTLFGSNTGSDHPLTVMCSWTHYSCKE